MKQTHWPFNRFRGVHLAVGDMQKVADLLNRIGLSLSEITVPSQNSGGWTLHDGETWTGAQQACQTSTARVVLTTPNQPGGLRDFVNTHGNRAHSFEFAVDDIDAAEDLLAKRGLVPMAGARHADGGGFSYFDTFYQLGVYLLLRQETLAEEPAAVQASDPFSTFHHAHIIVDDIDAVAAYLDGVGIHMNDYPHPGNFTLIEGLDEDGFWKLGYKHAECGPVHFQLMSPASEDSGHKRFVAQYRRRAFSIGFVVEDIDAKEDKLKQKGLNVLMKGRHEDGWGFTYFNTIDDLGVHLCIRCNPRA